MNGVGRAVIYESEVEEIPLSVRKTSFTIFAKFFGSTASLKIKNG